MTAFKTAGPLAEPLSLGEVKAFLRVEHDSEDQLLEGLIGSAREDVERSTGTALIHQDWRKVLDAVPADGVVRLAPHPVKEILSVTVYGADGEGVVVDPADYDGDTASRPARLAFRTPPRPGQAFNGVEIDYRAGFGEAGPDVPDLLKRAMLLLVAHWYEFRTAIDARGQPISYPGGYQRLIAPFKARRV